VRRTNVNLLFRLGANPSTRYPPARECESVRAILVDYGKLEVVIEGSGIDRFPLHIVSLSRAARIRSLIWIKNAHCAGAQLVARKEPTFESLNGRKIGGGCEHERGHDGGSGRTRFERDATHRAV
jgi:hypothetical protein